MCKVVANTNKEGLLEGPVKNDAEVKVAVFGVIIIFLVSLIIGIGFIFSTTMTDEEIVHAVVESQSNIQIQSFSFSDVSLIDIEYIEFDDDMQTVSFKYLEQSYYVGFNAADKVLIEHTSVELENFDFFKGNDFLPQ